MIVSNKKKFIIALPGFVNNNFQLGKHTIISIKEIFDLEFLRILLKDAEEIAVGNYSLEDRLFRPFIGLLFILVKAQNKYFIDNNNSKETFSFLKFLFIDTPLFILELIFDLLLVIFSWIILFIFYLLPERGLLRRFTPRNDNLKKIVYLRTDNFRGLQEGGSFTHFRGVIKGFYELGYKVYYIGSGEIKVEKINFEKFIIPYPKSFSLPEIPEIYYNWRFIPKALKIIKEQKPLFIYQRHSIFNVCGALLSQLAHIPLILEYNGSEPWVRQKWGGLLIFKKLCYFMENFSLKKSDLIVVVSKPLKEELLKRGIPENKILINYNGVDPEEFKPNIDSSNIFKKYNLENKIVIGAVSTFGVWHGMSILAQAVKPIVQQFQIPNSKFQIHFLFIGDGVQRPECERIIKEDKMENYVTFTGIVPYQEIPQYLAACYILVSPHVPNPDGTEFFGSPTKLFEYMAMAKGIVASNLAQIGEILEDKKTALLVKPKDIEELVNAIVKLIKDKKLREDLGKNAREKVISNYTWKENVKRIVENFNAF
jgi:glycosyltransferase involved in cell wall biosynthesis